MNGHISVLHVEDDPSFADLTQTYLERADDSITVQTETNASDGLTHLDSNDIDCVVSDYDMPGMNGIEFLEAVREEYHDIPFILFTGKGSEEVAADAVAANVSGYLQKGGTDTFELLANRIQNEVADYRIATSYREYKTVVEALTDPVYVLDERGQFTTVNDAFLELTGYEESEIIGSDASLIKTEESVAQAEDYLGRLLSSDGPDDVLFEIELQTADGETVRCEDHLGVIPFEGDQFQGSVGVLRNISSRQESEQFRRELYEIAARSDIEFEEACRRMLQLTCNRLDVDEGKLVRTNMETDSHETLFAARDQDLEGTVANLSKTYCRRVVESGDSVAFHDAAEGNWTDDPAFREYGHACYAGTEVTVDGEQFGTICFFSAEPQPVSFTDSQLTFVELVGRIIGQMLERNRSRENLQRREEALRRIHEIVSNQDQTYTERIRGLLDLGRATLDTTYGSLSSVHDDRYHIEIMSGSDEQYSAGAVLPLSDMACERTIGEQETQAAGQLSRDSRFQDHPVYTEYGVECYIGTPVYEGKTIYGTLCFFDETGREQPFSDWEITFIELISQWVSYALEERANKEALSRERDRLDEFASVVSHDLRNPLRVAKINLDLAQEERESEPLTKAENSLERAEDLIEGLLSLAREGDTGAEPEPVALDDIVTECWQSVPTGNAELVIETELVLRADINRLRQLFENLFRNAVEHGGNEVTVTVGNCTGGFYVADNGRGIPPEKREDVFNAGHSLSSEGTGFGLAIVEQIVAAHGWEILVTDSDSGGTRFEVTGVTARE